MPGAERIGPKRPRRLYLKEWREKYRLTQKALAGRLGVASMTVSRWETKGAHITDNVLAAIAEALDPDNLEPQDFYHHPDRPSAEALLRNQPAEVREQAIAEIMRIVGRQSRR